MSRRLFNSYNRKRIDFEDDLVIVFDNSENQIYKGIEDYEPMKDCDWKWDDSIKAYKYNDYIKICLDV
jgi:hypothetical protein